MRMVDLIEKKVDGGALSHDEIETMIKGYVDGEIPDYQMAAFMMAVVFAGHDAFRRSCRPFPAAGDQGR